MSAAGPMPPPPPHSSHSASNGDDGTGRPNKRYTIGYTPTSRANGHPPYTTTPISRLDAIKLEAERRVKDLGPAPIKTLLKAAQSSFATAKIRVDQRRGDDAYTEFLTAYKIMTECIPSTPGYHDLLEKQTVSTMEFRELVGQMKASTEQFASIKNIIINEEVRSAGQESQRPVSMYGQPSAPSPSRSSTDLESISGRQSNGYASSYGSRPSSSAGVTSNPAASSRTKPPVRPKPNNLHGQVISTDAETKAAIARQAELVDRFAKLRASAASPPRTNGSPVRMPSPSDYVPSKPAGPREMPGGPSIPPKLPLNTDFAAVVLPRPPDAAYSPARNMQTPVGVNPPRSTARSTIGTGGRDNMMAASSASSRAPGGASLQGSYFPPSNGERRQGSIGIPTEGHTIEPNVLYDTLNLFSVLVIDLRSRTEFDRGHINWRDILCVEPLTLRAGMSAEQLHSTLILSPDLELELFERIDQFDLVVLYDNATADPAFLNGFQRTQEEEMLKRLYDALWTFNSEKQLKRAPLLLSGGLNAWKNLLGDSALATSDTAATKAMKKMLPARRPVATRLRASSLNIDKRRRREYNPLDADELQKWEERTRQESAVFAQEIAEEPEEPEEGDEGADFDYARTHYEFLRKYPPIRERESMSGLMPDGTQVVVRPPPPPAYQNHYPPPPMGLPPAVPAGLPSRPVLAAARVSYRGAHELTPAPYNNNARGSELRPYISRSETAANMRLSRTGLINFGVTCYMNATLQCLNATIAMTLLFRTNSYRQYLQRENWKGSKGLLSENYATLINHLWKGDVVACRPSTFRHFCARLNTEWGLDRQQDAAEFLEFVLDFLHEDLNINWQNPPPHVLSAQEEAMREQMYKGFAASVEWSRYSKRDKSLISDLFAGQHASRLRCRTCNHTSTTYETFFSVSVEIPRSGTSDIHSCLRSYCKEEKLSGDEVWRCPVCKQDREATKQITLTRAPKHLIVHFKRFSASHRESARKVSTPIAFPLSGLDIAEYMLPAPTPSDVERTVAVTNGDTAWRNNVLASASRPPYVYDCYAVMRHLGPSISSGHYVALTRDPGRGNWHLFNDDRVSDFEAEALGRGRGVDNEQAYIVFFQRRE